MDKVTVSEAREEDYKAIYRLNRIGLGYDFDIEATKKRLSYVLRNTYNKIFVAKLDGDIIGHVHAADYDCVYAGPLKNILAIVVDEEKRGLGIGKMLLYNVETWAKESGASGVRLVSGFNRTNAHKFYLSCGYNHRKDQKNFIKLF